MLGPQLWYRRNRPDAPENESLGSWTKNYEYDPYGRVTSETMTNGTDITKTKTYQYDSSNGLLSRKTMPGGVTTRYYYVSGANGLVGLHKEKDAPIGTVTNSYVLITDHLGSITMMVDGYDDYNEIRYDPWGNRTVQESFLDEVIDRGYTGHEHLDQLGLGRMYDPLQGRFLSPDNYIQAPDNPQNYNRYSYCLNNPLKYTDPSGEFAWIPVLIGAAFGGYSGYKIAELNGLNFENVQTYGYILGGAVLGGLSGLLGASAASSNFLPCTLSNMVGSSASSLSMSALSGGQMTPSVNFGFASLDFGSKKVYSFGNSRSVLETIGYGFGALGNLSDVLAGRNAGVLTGRVENDPNAAKQIFGNDAISHYQITDENSLIIDWGPGDGNVGTNSYELDKYQNRSNFVLRSMELMDWSSEQAIAYYEREIQRSHIYQNGILSNLKGGRFLDPVSIAHVNINSARRFGEIINGNFKYHLLTNNCSQMASRALAISGVPTILGAYPYLLHAQLYLRSMGVRPCLYSYYGSLIR